MANSQEKFQCTELKGYYKTNDLVSEQDILDFAHSIISKRFLRGKALSSPQDSENFLRATIGHLEHEVFGMIFLNNKNFVIAYEELFRGTIDNTPVFPREVIKRTLHHNAAAVILSHNHPSGNPEPSQADLHITEKLKSAFELIDVRVLDHIIIAGTQSTSLAEQGHF